MVNSVKVSVIIPVYNCEKVIPATLESVRGQTLGEIEIIVLNDGSTDSTLLAVEGIAKNDTRIKVISLKNGGPAKARNVGISQAKGEYIAFMDSDDLLDADALETMYKQASGERLDICACGYLMESPGKQDGRIFSHEAFIARTADEFRPRLMSLIKSHLMYVVWNKLYSREFLSKHNLLFTDYLSGEDRLFNIQCFKHIERFGYIDRPFYHYVQWGGSTLANRYIANRFEATLKAHIDFIRAYKDMDIYTKRNKEYLEFVFIKGVMACFCQLFLSACPLQKPQKFQYIKSTLEMPWVKEAIKSYDEDFGYSKKINQILRTGNARLIYMTAWGIYVMQSRFNGIYQGVKHNKRRDSNLA